MSPTRDAPVKLRLEAGIAHVTLDRPAKRNALDRATITAMIEHLQHIADDPAVRVVQITGAGTVFCAGADLAEMQAQIHASEADNRANAEHLASLLTLLDSLPKPTLARVNGDGYGGALGLIGACDIAVVAADAKFAFTEVRLGIVPAVISPFVLPKMGESAARRYFLTAETLTAAQLKELGLAHEVVPSDSLDATCMSIAEAIAKGAPQALAEAKSLIRDVVRASAADRGGAPAAMAARLARLRVQAEAQEGFSAFFAKRAASWRRS
ncbi:MAG TPA: enoyl-CoA hydratase-related protein [Steroidobacteraceae bacterium]|nr:enoyl-CoA hydratase-related protein [Steroidobacteraceae bacterium]